MKKETEKPITNPGIQGLRTETRLYRQECAILAVTECVCQLMDKRKVSRSELARRLGRTKGYVTRFLGGRSNMTVRAVSDIFTALDSAVNFRFQKWPVLWNPPSPEKRARRFLLLRESLADTERFRSHRILRRGRRKA